MNVALRHQELKSYGDWELQKMLGSGGFGEVLLWQNRKTFQYIATKRCLKDPTQMQLDELAKVKERWQKEYEWTKNLNIQNIVKGIEVKPKNFVEYLQKSHTWDLPVIIMEYCNGGDLRTEMQKVENSNGLREYDIRQILHCLKNAVLHLHDHFHIAHRDIKPENIVIHRLDGGKKAVYKLTDLGFARHISSDTIAASVVGTKNYFAPEILDVAKYTNTVDYWSLGIIAFEIMCGVYPFIPHQTIYQIVRNIKQKQKKCIAVTETWKPTKTASSEIFVQHDTIFPENRLSKSFQKLIENWLRLALDQNYKTRGHQVNLASPNAIQNVKQLPRMILTFYKELDSVLDSKILTVFCLNTYQFCSYEVDHSTLMHELANDMELDTGICQKDFFFIFPTGHPTGELKPTTKPVDLYIQDFNPEDDSGVMLFLLGYKQKYMPGDPYISSKMQNMLDQINDVHSIPKWVEDEFILQINFLLRREHRHLKALMTGLREYSLTIENDLFNYEKTIRETMDKICVLSGCVQHFSVMVAQGNEIINNGTPGNVNSFNEYQGCAQNFENELTKLNEVGQKIEARTRSAVKRIREYVQDSFMDEIIMRDIFNISEFEELIASKDKNLISKCQSLLYNCLENRKKFIKNTKLEFLMLNLYGVHEEARKIHQIVENANAVMDNLKLKIFEITGQFQGKVFRCGEMAKKKLSLPLNYLNYDGNSIANHKTVVDIFNKPQTDCLIQEAMENIDLLNLMRSDLSGTLANNQ